MAKYIGIVAGELFQDLRNNQTRRHQIQGRHFADYLQRRLQSHPDPNVSLDEGPGLRFLRRTQRKTIFQVSQLWFEEGF